jgi:exopolysaccharide biosynthesis WecB/TagA/CpsF family protein
LKVGKGRKLRLTGKNFAVEINVPTQAALMSEVAERFQAHRGFALATINLDHVTKLERDESFREAYAAQDLVVADGNPIVWVSRLAGKPVDLMPGSELVLPLAQLAAEQGATVALIGSSDASLAAAADALKSGAPRLQIIYVHAPAFGFDPKGEAARQILKDLAASGAQLAFLALGAPKQEHFAALGRELAPKVGFASIGAGLDFLSGTQVRAPEWVRKIAMEWLWRMLGNPRRMFGRYAQCALVLPRLAWRAYRRR